jgi:hypothetical protein
MSGLAIALALSVIALPAAVPAQNGRGSIDQIHARTGADRVSSAPADIAPKGQATGIAPSPQLTSGSESMAPAAQLTKEGRSVPQPMQLYRGGRTAQPSQPLSRPSDGRTATVDPVGGKDRCDPASDRALGKKCAGVIENRSAEFARKEPQPLSPEQRIIAEQQSRDQAQTVGSAAKRLAVTGEDADSIEAQGVASVVLRKPPEEPRDKPRTEPLAADQLQAIVNAIVGPGVVVQPPN